MGEGQGLARDLAVHGGERVRREKGREVGDAVL